MSKTDDVRRFAVSLCGNCDCIHLSFFDERERVVTELALPDESWDAIFTEVAMQQKMRDGAVKPS